MKKKKKNDDNNNNDFFSRGLLHLQIIYMFLILAIKSRIPPPQRNPNIFVIALFRFRDKVR